VSLSLAERRIAVLGATRLALFRRRRGELELLGGDSIDHTPKEEVVKLRIGPVLVLLAIVFDTMRQ